MTRNSLTIATLGRMKDDDEMGLSPRESEIITEAIKALKTATKTAKVLCDESNFATILAALRLFQKVYDGCTNQQIADAWPDHFTRNNGSTIPALGSEDIDGLCEDLNYCTTKENSNA